MDMVAKQAATSPGSLYQFFPNRTALLTALIERYGKAISSLAKDLVREQTERPLASMAQAARDFLAPFLDFYAHNRAYVILAEASRGHRTVGRELSIQKRADLITIRSKVCLPIQIHYFPLHGLQALLSRPIVNDSGSVCGGYTLARLRHPGLAVFGFAL